VTLPPFQRLVDDHWRDVARLAHALVGPVDADEVAHLPDDALWNAVRTLPERQRLAIALRFIGDLDHAELARQLRTTPAATRRLVSDALATLRARATAQTHPATQTRPATRTHPEVTP
jgi:DNA-directed RNA polymerase specialized sigma24 family protein